jgi:hypothetical protein
MFNPVFRKRNPKFRAQLIHIVILKDHYNPYFSARIKPNGTEIRSA